MSLNTNNIQQLYVAYFGRPADFTGLNYWEGVVAAQGGSTTAVSAAFAASAEYTATFAGLSNDQIVNTIYNNLFHRDAEVAGLTYWSNLLTAGRINISNVVTQVAGGAQGTDSTALAQKVAASVAFTAALDTTAEILSYNGATAVAIAKTWLAGIYDVATETAAVATAALNATIASLPVGGAPGTTYTLTTGVDNFVGTANNDTFNAVGNTTTGATFSPLDSINGGTGSNDTLNWSYTGAVIKGTPGGATVTGVEIANVTSDNTITLDTTSGWTGLTSLLTTNSGAAQTITVAATTDVTALDATPGATVVTIDGGKNISATVTGGVTGDNIVIGATTAAVGTVTVSSADALAGVVTGGTIAVTGGTVDTITSKVTNSTSGAGSDSIIGGVTVTGTSNTTTVSVTESPVVVGAAAVVDAANSTSAKAATFGVTASTVDIADANAANSSTATTASKAGTIATVSLNNYGVAKISSAALNSLTLAGTGASVATLEAGSTAATNTVLALNLNGGTHGSLTDSSAQFKTINAVLTANTTITTLADTALTTLAISGTGVLKSTTIPGTLTSVTVKDAAGFSGSLVGTGVTSFTAANTTANNTVTLTSTTQSYTGGSGVDTVTIAADATKVITAGTGTSDKLILTSAQATYTLANTGANVTGFDILDVNAAGALGTYNLANFATGITSLEVGASTTTSASFSHVTAGTALQIDSTGATIGYATSDTNGVDDSVAVTLAASAATGIGLTVASLTLTDANAVGIGTVSIAANAPVYQGLSTITSLVDSGLKVLNITGTGSLSITGANTGSTSLTISDNGSGSSLTADGIVTLTAAANLLGSISYSGTHAFTIGTLADTVANATITNANTGSTGVLTIGAFTDASLTNLTLNGSVALTGTFANAAAVTISGATDNQASSITAVGAGVRTITLGNGGNTVVTGSGNDVITLGTGANTVTGAAGGDTITFGTHTGIDTVLYSATGQSILGSVTSGTTALTAANGADIYTGLHAGDSVSLAALTANAFTAGALGTSINGATGGTIEIVTGDWVSGTGVFTTNATGHDSIIQYNNLGTGGAVTGTQETIVLVGFVNTASTTTNDGVITLS